MTTHQPDELEKEQANLLAGKWAVLLLLAMAVLLVMGVWFSASAVLPSLTQAWGLGDSGRAWLTISVQAGFVAGSLVSVLLNLSDRVPARHLFTVSAFLAALSTAAIAAFVGSLLPALVLRFLTGAFMVGVYQVGMKIMTTWTKADRGLGIGLLIGAIAIGTASPHLINALGPGQDWRFLLFLAAGIAALGGILAWLFIREGPYRNPTPRFNWRYAIDIARTRELRLANLGYLGHMWELFAMWAWVGAFLLASFQTAHIDAVWASLGFLLTMITIRLLPTLEGLFGWRWAFTFLAFGPAVGIWAMASLRRMPVALKIAGGNR